MTATNAQVRIMMREREKGKTLEQAAATLGALVTNCPAIHAPPAKGVLGHLTRLICCTATRMPTRTCRRRAARICASICGSSTAPRQATGKLSSSSSAVSDLHRPNELCEGGEQYTGTQPLATTPLTAT